MLICAVGSLGLSRPASERLTAGMQSFFAPIAGPLHWLSGVVRTPRPLPAESNMIAGVNSSSVVERVSALEQENKQLRRVVLNLSGQIESLTRKAVEVESAGQKDGAVVQVISAEASGRSVLRLLGTDAAIRDGDAVVFDDGLVGQVRAVGSGQQAMVRLITDKGFKLTAAIGRFDADGFITIPLDATIAEGIGGGEMRIDAYRYDEVVAAGVKPGDLVVLHESESAWPLKAHGRLVGVVTLVQRRVDAAGFAEIRLRPKSDLLTLNEVRIIPRNSTP